MDLLAQTSLLLGIASFAFGASVLARNTRNKLFISFACLGGLISVWALSFFFSRVLEEHHSFYYTIHLFANIWLGPLGLYMIREMLRIRGHVSRTLFRVSFIGAIVLSGALMVGLEQLIPVLILMYFAPFTIVIQTVHLMSVDVGMKRGLKILPKRPTVGITTGKRILIYLGGLLVLATSVLDHIPFVWDWVPSFGNIALTIYLFFISQAITQQRFLNVNALFSRVLVLLTLAFTLTVIYSLFLFWMEQSPAAFFLYSFVISFLLVVLLDPIRTGVNFLTQRLLTQQHRRLTQLLREAQAKLSSVLSPAALYEAILLLCRQMIQPDYAALYVLESDGTKFLRVQDEGESTIETREILADHLLIAYGFQLRQRGELPVILDQALESELERLASRSLREKILAIRQALKALDANLFMPFFDAGKVLGFVVMRTPGPPEPWGNSWGFLQTLYPYFEQAGQVMRNMEIFVRQREKERLAALGEMAAGLAHEIRNPLGAIKGAAQFLDPSADRPESKFLKVIVEEVDRLNRVVTQFLDYSKPHAAEHERMDVSRAVAKTMDALMPILESKHIETKIIQPSEEAWITGASVQIQQIVMNLVQNGIKAVQDEEGNIKPDARLSVEVKVDQDFMNRKRVLILVEDNGRGIAKQNIHKIFIPFFTTSPSGSGLGLSICQKLAEAHHGRIEVQSEPGRMTRFSVILPYASERDKV